MVLEMVNRGRLELVIGGQESQNFFIMFIHTKEKKIQCRYESPTEETREEHGYLVVKWKIKGCEESQNYSK